MFLQTEHCMLVSG